MSPPCRAPVVALVSTLLAATVPATAPTAAPLPCPTQGASLTLTEENDLVVRTDRHYTQGVKLTWLSADDQPAALARGFRSFPPLALQMQAQKFGLSVGQNIYTPKDKKSLDPPSSDRPYAGWLYLGLIWQRRGTTWLDCPALDHFELDVGIIGPESFAQEAQTFVHQLRRFDVPNGWKHQLDTEFGKAVKWQRHLRLAWRQPEALGADLIPHLGASLGNVGTYAAAGGMVRVGYRLPDDFGVQIIDSISVNSGGRPRGSRTSWGFYLFAAAEERAVAYTVFLDGNLNRRWGGDGPHVNKEPFVGDLRAGAVLNLKYWDLAYTQVWRGDEFTTQRDGNAFGSFSLSAKF